MKLTDKQIASCKRVGKCSSGDVFEVVAKGGLVILEVRKSNGGREILGAGPHVGIARYIAECTDHTLKFNDLQKSQSFMYTHEIEDAQELTRQFREVLRA